MKFYYDDIGYECTWRNNLKGSITSWSNMEFAKIKVRIPLSLYRKILFDLKEFDGDEPEFVYFVKDISRNCEIVDYNKAW